MKYKIDRPTEFKILLIQAVLAEWQLSVNGLEAEYEKRIGSAKDFKAVYESFSERELLEQEFRVKISSVKTAIQNLTNLHVGEPSERLSDLVQPLSLFDITTISGSESKTITYFILPCEAPPSWVKKQCSLDGKSVNLLFSNSTLIGKKIGEEWHSNGGPIFEELHMGHWVSNGKVARPFRSTISFLYR